MRQISINDITNRFELGFSYPIPNIPPVHKSESGWTIRILVGESWGMGGSRNTKWDYFRTDLDGVIKESPRGFAKEYNKKVQITDLADWKV